MKKSFAPALFPDENVGLLGRTQRTRSMKTPVPLCHGPGRIIITGRLPVLCLRIPCNDSCTRLPLVTEDSLITVQREKASSCSMVRRTVHSKAFVSLEELDFCYPDSCCHSKLGPNQNRWESGSVVILILDPPTFPCELVHCIVERV